MSSNCSLLLRTSELHCSARKRPCNKIVQINAVNAVLLGVNETLLVVYEKSLASLRTSYIFMSDLGLQLGIRPNHRSLKILMATVSSSLLRART